MYGPGDLITCQCCLLSGHGGGAGILKQYNSSELRNTGEMGDGSMYKGTKKQDLILSRPQRSLNVALV